MNGCEACGLDITALISVSAAKAETSANAVHSYVFLARKFPDALLSHVTAPHWRIRVKAMGDLWHAVVGLAA